MRRATICAMTLLLATGCVRAEGLTRAELSAGEVTVSWQAGMGMQIEYRGNAAFVPFSSQYTVHNPDWSTTYYSSRGNAERGVVEAGGGAQTLVVRDAGEAFSFEKRVTLEPDGRVVIEHDFGQRGLADAHLQLGMRPAVPWMDGAAYRVVTEAGEANGRMTVGRGLERLLWTGLRELRFGSLTGSWRMTTTHGMSLYDDRDKGNFFLGWDQPLADGERYQETVTIEFVPATDIIAGATLSDFAWMPEVRDATAAVSLTLAAEQPRTLSFRLAALRGDEAVAETAREVALAREPTAVELSLTLPEPGEYRLRLTATDAAGETVLEQVLATRVLPLLRFVPGLSLYTHETQGELLVMLNARPAAERISAELSGEALGGTRTVEVTGLGASVSFDLMGVADGRQRAECVLRADGEVIARAATTFAKAPPKPGEVKIDGRSRGLIVDGKPFFPFGFYAHRAGGPWYDDPDPQLVLRLDGAFGFNLICVYHSFPPEYRRDKRQTISDFLDYADAVGLGVHYDVRQIADLEPSTEVSGWLAEEVEAHRDQPGLLTWYLSDEPCGRGIPPDRYVVHNAQMKQLDPYHPTAMVFCVPAKAHEYAEGMDILMVDPYPVPRGPLTRVAETVDLVVKATGGSVPVWCVPQAFGGGEWWEREPTWQEERCMTYLAIAHGATGIQYFLRRVPHSNPFVDATWAECRKLAREARELTPALLSHEPRPAVSSPDPELHLAAWRYNGWAYVLTVNVVNGPRALAVTCDGAPTGDRAEVMFEDRSVPVSAGGEIADLIDGYGVRIYRYRVGPVVLDERSPVVNGGFERATNAGYPDGYRVSYAELTGASWGTDPLEAIEGTHALSIRTPAEGKGITVSSFPAPLAAGSYELSLYLKADRPGASARISTSSWRNPWPEPPATTVEVGTDWQRVTLRLEVPESLRGVHVNIRPSQRGVLWADALQIVPAGD